MLRRLAAIGRRVLARFGAGGVRLLSQSSRQAVVHRRSYRCDL